MIEGIFNKHLIHKVNTYSLLIPSHLQISYNTTVLVHPSIPLNFDFKANEYAPKPPQHIQSPILKFGIFKFFATVSKLQHVYPQKLPGYNSDS